MRSFVGLSIAALVGVAGCMTLCSAPVLAQAPPSATLSEFTVSVKTELIEPTWGAPYYTPWGSGYLPGSIAYGSTVTCQSTHRAYVKNNASEAIVLFPRISPLGQLSAKVTLQANSEIDLGNDFGGGTFQIVDPPADKPLESGEQVVVWVDTNRLNPWTPGTNLEYSPSISARAETTCTFHLGSLTADARDADGALAIWNIRP